nr:reverse transcriptase domain-containing protein [Tanacetum cinerariifolium]
MIFIAFGRKLETRFSCPDGEVGNTGFPRLISHLKRLHLPFDEHKGILCEAISTDHGLYMAVKETLKVFNQWLWGKCMDLHAVSRACHHPDSRVCFSKGTNDMRGYIVGITKPSNKEFGTEITKGLVLDVELLDRVFQMHITTVKYIPYGCRLAFSQELKIVLCKVVTQPDSIDAWVRLLLFPRCTLQVYRLKNRQERRSRNKKSLQQSSILKSLAMWGEDDGITMLVKIILDGSVLGSFGQGGVKVLSSFDVALYCDDTIKDLEAKYPYKPPPLMPSITYSEPPFVAEIDSVFSCIKSFPKGTIRRRLISKVAMKGVDKEMLKYHSDFQFGVGVSGGAKAILHSVNRVLSEYHNDGSLAMLTVNFLNAFNVTFLIFRYLTASLICHTFGAFSIQGELPDKDQRAFDEDAPSAPPSLEWDGPIIQEVLEPSNLNYASSRANLSDSESITYAESFQDSLPTFYASFLGLWHSVYA